MIRVTCKGSGGQERMSRFGADFGLTVEGQDLTRTATEGFDGNDGRRTDDGEGGRNR
jgi:hypothetical protein